MGFCVEGLKQDSFFAFSFCQGGYSIMVFVLVLWHSYFPVILKQLVIQIKVAVN